MAVNPALAMLKLKVPFVFVIMDDIQQCNPNTGPDAS